MYLTLLFGFGCDLSPFHFEYSSNEYLYLVFSDHIVFYYKLTKIAATYMHEKSACGLTLSGRAFVVWFLVRSLI